MNAPGEQNTPIYSVAALIIHPDGNRFLAGYRVDDFFEGVLRIPSERLNQREKFYDAFGRLLREEVGVKVKTEPIYLASCRFNRNGRVVAQRCFGATALNDVILPVGNEMRDLKYISLEEFDSLADSDPYVENIRRFVQIARRNSLLIGEL